jgi:hypothetical protein
LNTANGLEKNHDSAEAAEKLNDVADRLVAQLEAAAEQGDLTAAAQVADLVGRVEESVADNLHKAQSNPARKKHAGSNAARQQKRARDLEAALERLPPAARKELKRKLENAAKHHKNKGRR